MNNTTDLVKSIIEGIQEKKGRDIAVANLTKIATAPCDYFVICTCGSPQQVDAVTDSVEEFTGNNMASIQRSLLVAKMPFGWQWTMAR